MSYWFIEVLLPLNWSGAEEAAERLLERGTATHELSRSCCPETEPSLLLFDALLPPRIPKPAMGCLRHAPTRCRRPPAIACCIVTPAAAWERYSWLTTKNSAAMLH